MDADNSNEVQLNVSMDRRLRTLFRKRCLDDDRSVKEVVNAFARWYIGNRVAYRYLFPAVRREIDTGAG